jgi:hypothetical protein
MLRLSGLEETIVSDMSGLEKNLINNSYYEYSLQALPSRKGRLEFQEPMKRLALDGIR